MGVEHSLEVTGTILDPESLWFVYECLFKMYKQKQVRNGCNDQLTVCHEIKILIKYYAFVSQIIKRKLKTECRSTNSETSNWITKPSKINMRK